MKKYLILFVIPLIFACGKSKEEIRLEKLVDSLQTITSQDQASINEYLKTFNEIQSNINAIKEKESIITTKTIGDSELEDNDVEAINNDILAIYEMMQENKKKLALMTKKFNRSNSKNAELNKMIKFLKTNIENKETELSDLRKQLEDKNLNIERLSKQIDSIANSYNELSLENESKDVIIEVQETEMNTAYYIIDTKKNLKRKGILKSDGGFIGIGRITKIKHKEEEFAKIDIREVSEFTLDDARKVQLFTDHPETSYTFEKNGKGKYQKLLITDAEQFWKKSKYLIIATK